METSEKDQMQGQSKKNPNLLLLVIRQSPRQQQLRPPKKMAAAAKMKNYLRGRPIMIIIGIRMRMVIGAMNTMTTGMFLIRIAMRVMNRPRRPPRARIKRPQKL